MAAPAGGSLEKKLMIRITLVAVSLVFLATNAVAQAPFTEEYDPSQVQDLGPAEPGNLEIPEGGNLLLNGSFETNGGVGTSALTDWIVFDVLGSVSGLPSTFGTWVVQTGVMAPISGSAVEAPTDGTFAAMADSTGPSSKVLYQDFTVPAAGGTVSCDVYVNNQNAAGFVDGGSLDWEAVANQQARVDIMDPLAAVDDVGAGVLANLFITNPGDPNVQSYQTIVGDLTPFGGQIVRLRLAEVDNQFFFNFGVDNCVVVGASSLVVVPTLNTVGLVLLVLLLAGLGFLSLRHRRA